MEPSAPPSATNRYFCNVPSSSADIKSVQSAGFENYAQMPTLMFLPEFCEDRAGHNFPTGPPVRSHHLPSFTEGQRLTGKSKPCAVNSITATTMPITTVTRIRCQVTPALPGPQLYLSVHE